MEKYTENIHFKNNELVTIELYKNDILSVSIHYSRNKSKKT